MTAPSRTPTGGRIDRSTRFEFRLDGRTYTGHPGDTLASSLLSHGVHKIVDECQTRPPPGISAAWAEDTGGLVQIEAPFPEPMLLASTVELHGRPRSEGPSGPGPACRYRRRRPVRRHAHARRRARRGFRPRRTHRGPYRRPYRRPCGAGGRAVRSRRFAPRRSPTASAASMRSNRSGPRPTSSRRTRRCGTCSAPPRSVTTTTASCWPSSGAPTTSATARLPRLSRQRVWRIRARHVLIATGAHERSIVFADNDLPGIMLAQKCKDVPASIRRLGRARVGAVHHQRQRLCGRVRPRRRRCTDRNGGRRPRAGVRRAAARM